MKQNSNKENEQSQKLAFEKSIKCITSCQAHQEKRKHKLLMLEIKRATVMN